MSFGQGGPSVTRVSAVNGTEVWDDGTNRGGGGFIMRTSPNPATRPARRKQS
jgi:hypothetical protein